VTRFPYQALGDEFLASVGVKTKRYLILLLLVLTIDQRSNTPLPRYVRPLMPNVGFTNLSTCHYY